MPDVSGSVTDTRETPRAAFEGSSKCTQKEVKYNQANICNFNLKTHTHTHSTPLSSDTVTQTIIMDSETPSDPPQT